MTQVVGTVVAPLSSPALVVGESSSSGVLFVVAWLAEVLQVAEEVGATVSHSNDVVDSAADATREAGGLSTPHIENIIGGDPVGQAAPARAPIRALRRGVSRHAVRIARAVAIHARKSLLSLRGSFRHATSLLLGAGLLRVSSAPSGATFRLGECHGRLPVAGNCQHSSGAAA